MSYCCIKFHKSTPNLYQQPIQRLWNQQHRQAGVHQVDAHQQRNSNSLLQCVFQSIGLLVICLMTVMVSPQAIILVQILMIDG